MPVNLRQDLEYTDGDVLNEVIGGLCAAINRAFDERGGQAIVAAAVARRREAKRQTREAAAFGLNRSRMAGFINHGGHVYHHLSDMDEGGKPRVLVWRTGRTTSVWRAGKRTKAYVWAWRPADDEGGEWRGQFENRADAFEAGRRELAAPDA
jgi:hypothetical protein